MSAAPVDTASVFGQAEHVADQGDVNAQYSQTLVGGSS